MRIEEAAVISVSKLPCCSEGDKTMSYTKFVASLVRANSGNVNKIRVSPARCRSTVASPKSQDEKKQQQLDGCTVVQAEPVELITQTRNTKDGHLHKIHIDFDNTEEAYKSKRNMELLRSLLVFHLCAVDVLVEKNKEVSPFLLTSVADDQELFCSS